MKRLAILALLSLLLCAPLPPLLAQPTYVTIADNAYTPVSGTVCNGQPHISSPDLITSTANALSAVPTDGGPHDAWHPSPGRFGRNASFRTWGGASRIWIGCTCTRGALWARLGCGAIGKCNCRRHCRITDYKCRRKLTNWHARYRPVWIC